MSIQQLSNRDGSRTPESKLSSEDIEKPGASTWTQDSSVFDNPLLAKFYAPPDSYESKHRFDPDARWTDAEEAAVIRKCDWRICLFVCILFAALQLDRGNISNALSDNFLADLHLTTNDYNLGQTIFHITFLCAELPSQLVSKKLGVDRWGGFIPDMILYLSYFYKADELAIRLSYFWVALTITGIISSLAAAGILQMRGLNGWAGWQYLFLIEGLVTLVVGIIAAFWLPPSPTQTAGRFRGKSWFTERQETIIVTRVLKDDPTKSSMHNRQAIGLKDLWLSCSDYDHFPLYILGLTTFIATGTVAAYFSLTLKGLGFSTFHVNLLMIPTSVISIFTQLGLSYLSRAVKERTFVSSLGSWWQLIFFIALVLVPDSTGIWPKYAIFTLLLAYPYCHPILVGWNSTISGSVRTRSVSASLYNISVQLGGIVSSNIYRTNDQPYYHYGNRVLLGIVSANLILFGLTKIYFIRRNAARSKVWEALSPDEQKTYLETTKDLGNRRLDFKFVH